MKNLTGLTIVFAICFFTFSSCKKEGTTVTKVVNVELKVNQSYTDVVPKGGDDDDVMQIIQQAGHYKVSEISGSGSSNITFNYTPALDYIGSDEIKVSNEEGAHKGKGPGMHGGCSGHHDDVTIYDFKINISGNNK